MPSQIEEFPEIEEFDDTQDRASRHAALNLEQARARREGGRLGDTLNLLTTADELPRQLGRGLATTGETISDVAKAYALHAVTPSTFDPLTKTWHNPVSEQQLGGPLAPGEVDTGEKPWEQGKAQLPLPLQGLSSAAEGLIRTSPQLALTAVQPEAGIISFGLTPEGFDPKAATIAALAPAVGRVAGGAVGNLAARAGAPEAIANVASRLAGGGAAATALTAEEAYHAWNMPPGVERDRAIAALGGNFAVMAALGMTGAGGRTEPVRSPEANISIDPKTGEYSMVQGKTAIQEFPETTTSKPEVSNAVVQEAAQPIRSLQPKPVEGEGQVPIEGNRPTPDVGGNQGEGKAAAPTIEPLKGERLAELVHPNGDTEIVSFADKFYDLTQFGKGKVPSIARRVNEGWSHGMAGPGDTIREITTPRETEVSNEQIRQPNARTGEEAGNQATGEREGAGGVDRTAQTGQSEVPTSGGNGAQEVESFTPLDPQSGSPLKDREAVGMGAARPSEFAPPKPFVTSNKNAVVDAERKARGLPPMMALERQSNQAAWDEATRKIDENPRIQDDLIAELQDKPRALTTTENALLMQRRIDLRNEYEKALVRWRDAFESDNLELAAEESQRVQRWGNELSNLEDVTKRTGAESGRSLQARKMMANEDYSLASMELASMAAKGRRLTPEETSELIRAQAKIADLQARLDAELQAQLQQDLRKSTDRAVKEAGETAGQTPKAVDPNSLRDDAVAGIKRKVAKGEIAEITPWLQKLAAYFWKTGIREREPMIDALHDVLKTIVPEISREETQRAFSGYGNFKPLSKDEVSVGLRDLRGQTQQVIKLEALEARKPLEKTGVERRAPSDEERRLIKQVNELKRKYGVVVTDPATQLRSALQSRKTYYTHRLADLRYEIEKGERTVKTKSPSPTDVELDALRAEYDQVKKEHDSIFGNREMTDAQRLKMAIAAAERSEAVWKVKLENAQKGIFDSGKPGRKVTSPELEAIRDRNEAARAAVDELKATDATLELRRQRDALEKSIGEYERRIKESDLFPEKKTDRPESVETKQFKAKRDILRKQLEDLKNASPERISERIKSATDTVLGQIDELTNRINSGDIELTPKTTKKLSTPELEELRGERKDLQRILRELQKAADPTRSAEAVALKSLKTRLFNRTAELRQRLADKDFEKRERKPVARDKEADDMQAQLDIAKEDFKHGLEQDRWQKSSVFEKTRRRAADIYDAARAIMTTGEFSFILRQGKFAALSHPIKTAKALPDTFRALLASESKARAIDLAVHNHPDAVKAKAAKLALVEEDVSLHKQEELLMGRLVGRLPVVRNFNRAAHVFLNKIRFDMWQGLRKAISKTGEPTPAEDAQVAMFVNEATGRGGLGKVEAAAVPLARVFFAPRYLMSRLQIASGHSMWGGTMRTRRAIATEYARALVGLGLYYTALKMAFSTNQDEKKNAQLSFDPRSSDFGKVKIGETRVDPLAGLAQVITFAGRTATGETKSQSGIVRPIRGDKIPYGGEKWTDVAARFGRSKLHPVPSTIANLFDGTDLAGNKATLAGEAGGMVAPITYVDVYQALANQDLPEGTALSLLALLGEGLQTYKKKQ